MRKNLGYKIFVGVILIMFTFAIFSNQLESLILGRTLNTGKPKTITGELEIAVLDPKNAKYTVDEQVTILITNPNKQDVAINEIQQVNKTLHDQQSQAKDFNEKLTITFNFGNINENFVSLLPNNTVIIIEGGEYKEFSTNLIEMKTSHVVLVIYGQYYVSFLSIENLYGQVAGEVVLEIDH